MKKVLITLVFFISSLTANLYDLSVVTIFQNEAPYLKEWIEFHRVVGVDHFYLLNNLSEDNYLEVLQPYIDEGIVELIDWPYDFNKYKQWNALQVAAYNWVLRTRGKKTKWMAIIDTDEFLFPVEKESLKEFLKEYEAYGAVAVNWQSYGTSYGTKVEEDQLMVEELTYKSEKYNPWNYYVKVIVQPKFVKKAITAHRCLYLKGFNCVTEEGLIVENCRAPSISVDQIRINHYWTRDANFFYHIKVPRQIKRGIMTLEECEERDAAFTQEEDLAIYRFLEPLKAAMFKAETF